MKTHLINFCIIVGLALCSFTFPKIDLSFQAQKYVTQTLTFEGKTFTVRAYENIIYVANPVDTVYQKMNIYIPEEYFSGKKINGYAAETAPIFFPNKVGGYMPAQPATLKEMPMGMGGNRPPMNGMPPMGDRRPDGAPAMPQAKPSTVVAALAKGYVVASAGARGRTLKASNGEYTGKAPAGIVDLKAAVRYLKFNDKLMPGDANKIISNGTSAGGAMSTLVGATGNNPDYEPYLKAIGAANGTDDVFAVSAYCPITNLDHADMAYEWQFNGYNTYKRGGPMQAKNSDAPSVLSEEQIKISGQLKTLFPTYINSLNLKDSKGKSLTLDADGNGSFKDLVINYVIASAQKALDAGKDMSSYAFLKVSGNQVTGLDFGAYVSYMERMKTPPAFDALDLSTGENMLFGSATIDKQHFTEFGQKNAIGEASRVDEVFVKMMNPMYYLGQKNTTNAKHWRIRHGSKDKDTSLAISVILTTALQNKGIDANLEFPWDKPHSGDYDLDELFAWIDGLCK
ncbi:alpha/beta hydrolase [Emticicia sp. ODNR4P]|nr:alpha/beta hydrolase [Emticicia sp. ODNR4P]